MAGIDSFLVSMGIKGQTAVLSEIEKVKNAGNKLNKLNPTLGIKSQTPSIPKNNQTPLIPKNNPKGKAEATNAVKSVINTPQQAQSITKDEKAVKSLNQLNKTIDKSIKATDKATKATTKSTTKSTSATKPSGKPSGGSGGSGGDSGGEGSDVASIINSAKVMQAFNSIGSLSHSMASLDPVSSFKGVTTALTKTVAAMAPVGGALIEAAGEIFNVAVDMGKSSLDMAKQSVSAYHQLADRNASTKYYGGNKVNQAFMSNNEKAMLISQISSSYGRIQQPLADEINKLVGTKDTRALGRVAAGNWESTGTDKGWMLQQISNGLEGLPPSVRQKFQSSLLSQNSEEIQDYSEGQKRAQEINAQYENEAENQTEKLYNIASAKNADFQAMNQQLNKMQQTLLTVGSTFIWALQGSAAGLNKLTDKLKDPLVSGAMSKAGIGIPLSATGGNYRNSIPSYITAGKNR